MDCWEVYTLVIYPDDAVIRVDHQIAVGRGRRVWVERGRLMHVPELCVTGHGTEKPREKRNKNDIGNSQGGVL